uniref:BPTI/Kunitz inhibitor domain-containing protein n=1 Tax=Kryptolebias marmoratus TaxID=37003 RepID=A0A3Q3B9W9_KRYMA
RPRCSEVMSEGSCSDYILLWYFHVQSGECRPFVYGGCGGNQNRFSSKQECQSWCVMERGAADPTGDGPPNT